MQTPKNVGITVAANGLMSTDGAWLRQFPYVLLIATWSDETATAIKMLHIWNIPVKYIRFMNDPREWLQGSNSAVINLIANQSIHPSFICANEPDIEGPVPDWVQPTEKYLHSCGFRIVEPAWSNDDKAPKDVYIPGHGYPDLYNIHSAHCYNKDWSNANKVAARCNDGRPVVITEYGHPGYQDQCLQDIADAKISPETDVVLFTLRWVDNQSKGFDLIGVEFK